MINKIFNWIFGSFFRTLGRVFVYFLIGILISYLLKDIKIPKIDIWQVLDVNANTVDLPYYDNGLDNIGGARVYNWTSSSSYTELNNSVEVDGLFSRYSYQDKENLGVLNGYFYGIKDISVSNFGSNGISLALLLENIVLVTNSYYSTTAYICTQNNTTININNIYVATGYNNSFNYPATYKKQILSQNIENSFDPIDYSSLSYCKMVNFIYRPAYDGSVLNIRLTSSDSVGDWFLVGTQTKMIADASNITTSDISNAINNSGLASASSVNEVQSSINQVQNQLNSSTNTIVNNQNSNKQEIITNANANSQAEIENANQNSQAEIENANANTDKTIDSQKVCVNYNLKYNLDNKSELTSGSFLNTSGDIINSSAAWFYTTNYLSINKNNNYYLSGNAILPSNAAYCLYDKDYSLVNCFNYTSDNLTINSNYDGYIRFSLFLHSNSYQATFTGSYCKNGNQAMNDTLTDSTPPTNLDSLNNSAGWLPAGPVDSILNLPLSFLTNLNTNLSKSCQPVNLPLPFVNKTLPLPCVNNLYNEIDGLPNWINIIGTIASAFILFGYFINLYKYVDDTLTFRENNYIDNWSGV